MLNYAKISTPESSLLFQYNIFGFTIEDKTKDFLRSFFLSLEIKLEDPTDIISKCLKRDK